MEAKAQEIFLTSSKLKESLAKDPAFIKAIADSAKRLITTVKGGGTIYSCGNGGSTADAIHLTEELVARYKRERPGIKAMHLMDPAVLTCWSNDYAYETVFARQVETFCGPADTVIGISTSGNSKNIIAAVKAAKAKGAFSIGLLGKDGGALKGMCDLSLVVPAQETERIQEAHITIIHTWCELVEVELFFSGK
ncbi:MAG: SIS domain-containing protein [Proteobacteria bacterium]|nr:SIS domain-containing protein [Pseudomonadota bacterium]